MSNDDRKLNDYFYGHKSSPVVQRDKLAIEFYDSSEGKQFSHTHDEFYASGGTRDTTRRPFLPCGQPISSGALSHCMMKEAVHSWQGDGPSTLGSNP